MDEWNHKCEEQQHREWKQLELTGAKILQTARDGLYLKMRFLDVALGSLAFVMDPQIRGIGTDGFGLYYETRSLGRMFRIDPVWVNRLYLHQVRFWTVCSIRWYSRAGLSCAGRPIGNFRRNIRC